MLCVLLLTRRCLAFLQCLQAALGSKPLNLARLHAENLTNPEEMVEWGRLIKASAALSVAIFAAIGTMGIEKLAPVLLTKEVRCSLTTQCV